MTREKNIFRHPKTTIFILSLDISLECIPAILRDDISDKGLYLKDVNDFYTSIIKHQAN